jgi:hypothetical protein
MDYLSNNNLAYLSDDNVYKSTFGIVENNEIINNDYDDNKDGTKEKNFLTDVQIQNLLENYENKFNNNNDKNKKLLFFIIFIFFFLIFCCFIF